MPTNPVAGRLAPGTQPITAAAVDRLARRADASGAAHPLTTPLTGEHIADLPRSTDTDVDAAFATARAAQPAWAATPLRERSRVLLAFHDLVLDHQRELLDAIQVESGKSREHAFDEISHTALVARHYARRLRRYLAPERHHGALITLTPVVTLLHPVGVVGVVAPWNYPLSLSVTDALAALAAGNAVVLRPDDRSAVTALLAVELLDRAGLPQGVLRVVLGDGPTAGDAVVRRGDAVAFTGSTAVGRTVAAVCGERLVPCSLELGGKNPLYVRADADVDRAARGACEAAFASAGQLCVSAERVYVDERVADAFTRAFVARAGALRLGTDLAYGADMGSLASAAQLERVVEHVDDAVAKGARVLTGGVARPDIGPYVYEPTVLTDVPDDALLARDETFGPVVSVYRVRGDDDAVAAMNDTGYGLNASVWTADATAGRRIATRVESGAVAVNDGFRASWSAPAAPMGGWKDSGVGGRHGATGIRRFTREQSIATQRLLPLTGPEGVAPQTWNAALTLGLKALRRTPLA